MNDRELLEMAANAAGLIDVMCPDGWTDEGPWRWNEELKWNPLRDDGDAFRLAVKLEIDISVGHWEKKIVHAKKTMSPYEFGIEQPKTIFVDESVDESEDAGPATRRAITRAAAEIGKAMP